MADHERHVVLRLVRGRTLADELVRADVIAVVGRHHDDRAFVEAERLQRLQQAHDMRVAIAYAVEVVVLIDAQAFVGERIASDQVRCAALNIPCAGGRPGSYGCRRDAASGTSCHDVRYSASFGGGALPSIGWFASCTAEPFVSVFTNIASCGFTRFTARNHGLPSFARRGAWLRIQLTAASAVIPSYW